MKLGEQGEKMEEMGDRRQSRGLGRNTRWQWDGVSILGPLGFLQAGIGNRGEFEIGHD
jgi:hypothetical protein